MDAIERMAKAALAALPADGAILLDSSPVSLHLAALLPADRELIVVTNSFDVATLLSTRPKLELRLVGGHLRPGSSAVVGPWSRLALRNSFVDIAFFGADGVTPAEGASSADEEVATFNRVAVAASRRVVVLADHTAVGRAYPATFATLADVDTLVTEADADPDLLREITAAGPQLVMA
ncbi:D-beta-D-heptose 1-phosphate adenosyltransferase [Actinophytocola sp.]|jgi:DeoR family fructose operon transcriptional repressor|uniref:DeoR/GlpR family DNA-binding transcription regulator n=1 Tax=Actinophytocola sp. TaxID=1872138 RepID=UPI002ED89805